MGKQRNRMNVRENGECVTETAVAYDVETVGDNDSDTTEFRAGNWFALKG